MCHLFHVKSKTNRLKMSTVFLVKFQLFSHGVSAPLDLIFLRQILEMLRIFELGVKRKEDVKRLDLTVIRVAWVNGNICEETKNKMNLNYSKASRVPHNACLTE